MLAAQQAQCAADAAADQKTYNDLKAQYNALNKAVYQHNLDVASYEQQLATFTADLAGFMAQLNAYLADCTGRTYTTTALNDAADQLDAARAPLVTRQSDLNDLCNSLQDEADQENQQATDLKNALKALDDSIIASLKALDCIKCSALTALQAQTESLMSQAKFTIKTPSGPPPQVPNVPRLPMPPAPGLVNGPPPPKATKNPTPPTAGPGVVVTEYFYAEVSYTPRGQEAPDTPMADPPPPVSP